MNSNDYLNRIEDRLQNNLENFELTTTNAVNSPFLTLYIDKENKFSNNIENKLKKIWPQQSRNISSIKVNIEDNNYNLDFTKIGPVIENLLNEENRFVDYKNIRINLICNFEDISHSLEDLDSFIENIKNNIKQYIVNVSIYIYIVIPNTINIVQNLVFLNWIKNECFSNENKKIIYLINQKRSNGTIANINDICNLIGNLIAVNNSEILTQHYYNSNLFSVGYKKNEKPIRDIAYNMLKAVFESINEKIIEIKPIKGIRLSKIIENQIQIDEDLLEYLPLKDMYDEFSQFSRMENIDDISLGAFSAYLNQKISLISKKIDKTLIITEINKVNSKSSIIRELEWNNFFEKEDEEQNNLNLNDIAKNYIINNLKKDPFFKEKGKLIINDLKDGTRNFINCWNRLYASLQEVNVENIVSVKEFYYSEIKKIINENSETIKKLLNSPNFSVFEDELNNFIFKLCEYPLFNMSFFEELSTRLKDQNLNEIITKNVGSNNIPIYFSGLNALNIPINKVVFLKSNNQLERLLIDQTIYYTNNGNSLETVYLYSINQNNLGIL